MTHIDDFRRDATITQMARAIRPYACFDIWDFARGVWLDRGFATQDIAACGTAAIRWERARRQAYGWKREKRA